MKPSCRSQESERTARPKWHKVPRHVPPPAHLEALSRHYAALGLTGKQRNQYCRPTPPPLPAAAKGARA